MPCANYTCEFCKTEFRRDAIGTHVRSKHIRDIADMLIEEYISYQNKPQDLSTLKRIMKGMKPEDIPIYSNLYENSVFFFGTKPNFFQDDESKSIISYKASSQNMEAHAEALKEITDSITLTDMIKAGIQVVVRSPEVMTLKKKLYDTEKLLITLQEDAVKNESYMASLKQDIADFKEMNDTNQSIAEMKAELQSTRHMFARAQREANNINESYKAYRQEMEMELRTLRETSNMSRLDIEGQLMDSTSKCREMEEKIKIRIQEGVAKELDKMRREKEKEKDKAKKDKKKAKEKLKEAAMMAKLKAKLKAKADKASSDSDSDSSDSDSSDSDEE